MLKENMLILEEFEWKKYRVQLNSLERWLDRTRYNIYQAVASAAHITYGEELKRDRQVNASLQASRRLPGEKKLSSLVKLCGTYLKQLGQAVAPRKLFNIPFLFPLFLLRATYGALDASLACLLDGRWLDWSMNTMGIWEDSFKERFVTSKIKTLLAYIPFVLSNILFYILRLALMLVFEPVLAVMSRVCEPQMRILRSWLCLFEDHKGAVAVAVIASVLLTALVIVSALMSAGLIPTLMMPVIGPVLMGLGGLVMQGITAVSVALGLPSLAVAIVGGALTGLAAMIVVEPIVRAIRHYGDYAIVTMRRLILKVRGKDYSKVLSHSNTVASKRDDAHTLESAVFYNTIHVDHFICGKNLHVLDRIFSWWGGTHVPANAGDSRVTKLSERSRFAPKGAWDDWSNI